MKSITVHDKIFEPYITATAIAESIKRIAQQLNEDYKDKKPLFIPILNGSFIFAADLFKEISIVIVEDIVDTGKTLNEFLPQLMHQQPASLKIAALLHKPDATIYPLQVDYLGFSVPNKFLLGYGLDYDGLGRNIPEIFKLAE